MLIDTHCHLDAAVFDADRAQVIERAGIAGVRAIVIPAVDVHNLQAVQSLARDCGTRDQAKAATSRPPVLAYALGIHPIAVPCAKEEHLADLEHALEQACEDPHLVAIGEIGLDFFLPELRTPAMRERQEWYYVQQLKLAHRFELPLLLHVRRAQDRLLKYLRRHAHVGGIAHAFNGSEQQAAHFLDQGFALGMGGAMTFARARRIRHLAATMPLSCLVLETDAPDIPPAWLGQTSPAPESPARNEPAEVAGVARELASLRQMPVQDLVAASAANAWRVLPRLAALMQAR